MTKPEVRFEQREETTIYGVWSKMTDQTAAKDISALSSEFHRRTRTKNGTVLPFFVLSRNYDEHTGSSELFIGGLMPYEGLTALVLSGGRYAVITVKPKLGFLWGLAVGEAKRFFYTQWLPQSGCIAQNMEYEYHTAHSIGKNPTVDIVFAIR